jgi:hypothetical protein
MPEGLFRYDVLLATVLAIASFYYGTTIKTIFLYTLRNMRHTKKFLKNKYKTYKEAFLFR